MGGRSKRDQLREEEMEQRSNGDGLEKQEVREKAGWIEVARQIG